MRHSRKLRLGAILALGATAAAMLAAAAAAAPLLKERFHDEGTFVVKDFCGVPGLTVDEAFVVDGAVLAVPHGRERTGVLPRAHHGDQRAHEPCQRKVRHR